MTDFDFELQRVEEAISKLEASAAHMPLSLPFNAEKATQYVYLLYHRAVLRGCMEDVQPVEEALNVIIERAGPAGDLYLLKANIDFKFHRLEAVARDLQSGTGLEDSPEGQALLGDLAFQQGEYLEAEQRYNALVDSHPAWDNMARLAYFKFKMGNFAVADECYSNAEDELTAKEMRHFAWLELQRGVIELSQGKLNECRRHYEMAERAYSGHWLVAEHRAELLAAEGRYADAAADYESVAARVPRPEFYQALSELYHHINDDEQAGRYRDRALAAYQESASRGNVHYYHHLADFYADLQNGPEALKWAQLDVSLRRNFSTLAALAWAHYLTGACSEALHGIEEALQSGACDAHLFSQAASIYDAVQLPDKAAQYAEKASAINPNHRSFHVHR